MNEKEDVVVYLTGFEAHCYSKNQNPLSAQLILSLTSTVLDIDSSMNQTDKRDVLRWKLLYFNTLDSVELYIR